MMRIEEIKQKENVIKLICSMNSKNDFEKQKMVCYSPSKSSLENKVFFSTIIMGFVQLFTADIHK